ncbi:hypothetical protein M9H77_16822 [Catharanthus roseus]|uniref:Uncharacterized protein n=1 Tax=Catharanthus roseus TaxID=4058 RepID=A0ACC0B2V3_CATRO|nr:hypothetical protein M9H77_16822 [Catharanthus roseus]
MAVAATVRRGAELCSPGRGISRRLANRRTGMVGWSYGDLTGRTALFPRSPLRQQQTGPRLKPSDGQDSGLAHAEGIRRRNDGHENNREEMDSSGDFIIGVSSDSIGGSSSGSSSSLGLTYSSGGEPQIA